MSDMLVLSNVYKSFGSRLIVNNVSLTVKEGEIFGFLGPNGAGKTTTIKMILGLLSIDSGTITVNGFDIEKDFENAMKHISGIVENPDMYAYLSGYDNLLIQANACGVDKSRIDEVVALVGMQNRIHDKFKSYSLGMKQRLGVAQALLHNPKIMILDEPTNGLDPAGIKEFRDLLRSLADSQNLAVLVSSHILQEMQLMCDHIGIIANGQLIRTGTIEEITMTGAQNVYRFKVKPMEQAMAYIRENLADRIKTVNNDHIELNLTEDEAGELNRALIQHEFTLLECSPSNTSLEQSFINITGGGNIVG